MVASPSSSVLSSSSSSLTPTSSTPSTSTITPATYAAATLATSVTVSTQPVSSHRPYPLSASSAHAGARTTPAAYPDVGETTPPNSSRIPVTPAVLRAIFASSRSPGEERSLSRIAFFRFSGFIISCLAISLMANQRRGLRAGATFLGVGV